MTNVLETRDGVLVRAEVNGLVVTRSDDGQAVLRMGCGNEARLGAKEINQVVMALIACIPPYGGFGA